MSFNLKQFKKITFQTGKIAHELEYVNHHVRNKLDELKRQELERLRHFASKEYELRNDIDTEHLKITPEHLDHSNPNTFEIEDLRKLIAKVRTGKHGVFDTVQKSGKILFTYVGSRGVL